LVANGYPIVDEDKADLAACLVIVRGQLEDLSQLEKVKQLSLATLSDRRSILKGQASPLSFKENEELDHLDNEARALSTWLGDAPKERARLENRANFFELSSQQGRWVVVRPAISRVQISFHLGADLGPLPPKTVPQCKVLGDLLLEVLKHQQNVSRSFYLAPLIALDADLVPVGMPDDVFREWKSQSGDGKSGKGVARAEELDAWHHVVNSWNTAFPNEKVAKREGGVVRERSNSAPKSPSLKPTPKNDAPSSSGSGSPPPAWVVENKSLASRVAHLEEELRIAKYELQQALEGQAADQVAECPLCPHCFPLVNQVQPVRINGKAKRLGFEEDYNVLFQAELARQKVPKDTTPSAPSRKEEKKVGGQAKGVKSPAPQPSLAPVVEKEADASLSLDQARELRRVLGLPHLDDVSGLEKADRDDYYRRSRLPKWATRGYREFGPAFLEDLQEGRVSGSNFNEWHAGRSKPSRAQLVAEWTAIRRQYAGVNLSARPSTASEQKLRGAYLKLRARCEKLGVHDVVPKSLPDRGASRSRSRGRTTSRAATPEPRVSNQPSETIGSLTRQQLSQMIADGVRAALDTRKK